MVTRRIVLGTGLTFAAVACAAGLGMYGSAARRHPDARSIDALLIDESIEMPRQLAAFIKASRRTLPVVGIQLDAAAHVRLMRLLDKSQALIGISSGATLFCLERLGWDHGFRLTGRSQQCASNLGAGGCRQDVAAFLSGAQHSAASIASLARAYRPSRADGTLHAWSMQKIDRTLLRQDRREA
jgi:hypothetical protein